MTGAEVIHPVRWFRCRAGWYESASNPAVGVYAIYRVDDRGELYWNVCRYRRAESVTHPGEYLDLVSTGMLADTLRSAKWQVAVEVLHAARAAE